MRAVKAIMALLLALPVPLAAQQVFDVDVTGGVVEPIVIGIPNFYAENENANRFADDIADVIENDLRATGLFRPVPDEAALATSRAFSAAVNFEAWRAVGAQNLVKGALAISNDGQIRAKYRLFNVVAQEEIGEGVQFTGSVDNWRRIAHKLADETYMRLTGEAPYFDSRIAFVDERGEKGAREKRIAMMDWDGENLSYLTDYRDLVLSPTIAPNNRDILYTQYENGLPSLMLVNSETGQAQPILPDMAFAFSPRVSPQGDRILFSRTDGGNTDIYMMSVANGQVDRLTYNAAVDTSADFAPDGDAIVFESDRSGVQSLYTLRLGDPSGPQPLIRSRAEPVSEINPTVEGAASDRTIEAIAADLAEGSERNERQNTPDATTRARYANPAWSPDGTQIAFTKITGEQFHIGIVNADGTNERILSGSFIDERPRWSPNGRALIFFRETAGEDGAPQLYSINLTGNNLTRVETPSFASDPDWSGLLN